MPGGTNAGTGECMAGDSNARAADQEHRAEKQVAGQHAGEQSERDHGRGERIDALRGAHDQAAVVAVGGMALRRMRRPGHHRVQSRRPPSRHHGDDGGGDRRGGRRARR
jgi:hypothetical protein